MDSIAAMIESMPEYLNAWGHSLSGLRHNRRKAVREIDIPFIESILRLRSEIGLKNKLSGWIETTLNLASFARIPRRERTDSAELILSLRELAGYSTPLTEAMGGSGISINEFIEFIKDFGSTETLSAGARIKGVLFTDVGIVYLRRFNHCFILGMNEGVFPSIRAEGTFLTQTIIDAIALSGFHTRRSIANHSSVETYYYGRAKSLSAEVTLSYLTCDTAGRKILPSQFVIDDCAGKIQAAEILEWLDHRSIPAGHFFPSDDEQVLCKPELKNVIADRIREDRNFLAVEANRELWKMAGAPKQDLFLEAVERMNSVSLPWNLSADNATGTRAASRFSPSDLNEYSACPFRFFLTRILKLYPPQEIFGYMSRGTDAHEILRTYFSRRKLDDFRRESDESISAEVETMVRERYIKEYGEQCLNEMGTVIGMDTLAAVLKNFLISERSVQSSLSTEVVMLERNFGFNSNDCLRIGEYEFKGKIDRVDTLHTGSNDVVIFDYKFTRPDILRSRHFNSTWSKPKNFELPVYSLYLKDVLGYNIAGALYYSLPKAGGKFDRAGFVEESKIVRFIPDIPKRKNTQISVLSEKEMEVTLDMYRNSVVETARNIREGKFPVTPEKGECDNCRHMAFCRNWGGSGGQGAT
jgi:ATP-dependent helicase/DNAse subunit B